MAEQATGLGAGNGGPPLLLGQLALEQVLNLLHQVSGKGPDSDPSGAIRSVLMSLCPAPGDVVPCPP